MGQINGRALLALGVPGDKRAAQLPAVPSVRESGGNLGSFNVASWNGLSAPARTPRDVIARLSREVQAALAPPEVKKRMLDLNIVAHGSTPEQLGELLNSGIRRWGEVITRANILKQ